MSLDGKIHSFSCEMVLLCTEFFFSFFFLKEQDTIFSQD